MNPGRCRKYGHCLFGVNYSENYSEWPFMEFRETRVDKTGEALYENAHMLARRPSAVKFHFSIHARNAEGHESASTQPAQSGLRAEQTRRP